VLYWQTKALRLHPRDAKKEAAMTRYGLRGILLGASLALLLAGGVAVAQGLAVTADQECLVCYPVPEEPDHELPPDEYRVDVTTTGWDYDQLLCMRVYFNGEVISDMGCQIMPAEADPLTLIFVMPCEGLRVNLPGLAEEILTTPQYDVTDYYGEWGYCARQPDGAIACASWRLAEVCEEEFVPEPGSMILLGSGLAGLAGYASLRWRSRK
jgi:hypothetical protein